LPQQVCHRHKDHVAFEENDVKFALHLIKTDDFGIFPGHSLSDAIYFSGYNLSGASKRTAT